MLNRIPKIGDTIIFIGDQAFINYSSLQGYLSPNKHYIIIGEQILYDGIKHPVITLDNDLPGYPMNQPELFNFYYKKPTTEIEYYKWLAGDRII